MLKNLTGPSRPMVVAFSARRQAAHLKLVPLSPALSTQTLCSTVKGSHPTLQNAQCLWAPSTDSAQDEIY